MINVNIYIHIYFLINKSYILAIITIHVGFFEMSQVSPPRRCIITIFEGFEVRTGVARGAQQAQPKAPKEEEEGPGTVSADYSKDYKDNCWAVGLRT